MRLVLASVGVAALLVGCVGEGTESPEPVEPSPVVTESPSPSPTVGAPSPSPSPSPSPTAFQSYPADLPTEDPESAAIIAGWQEYQRVLRKFSADPQGFTDFSETQYVTTGEKANGILDEIEGYREQGLRILGDFRYDNVEVGEAALADHGSREAVVSYCVDRAAMKVVDYEGRENATDHLTPRYPESATLVEGADGTWRVALVRNDQEATC